MSQETAIAEVTIELENSDLIVAVLGDFTSRDTFCFYFFVNEKRVFNSGYSLCSTMKYNLAGATGIVRVKAFHKDCSGNIKSEFSSPLFVSASIVQQDLEGLSGIDRDSGFKVSANGFVYPIVHFPGSDDFLFVMLTAAIDRKRHMLPAFNRWTWAGKGVFPGHVLCISDPTISVDNALGLGWYFGDQDRDAVETLAVIVKNFSIKLGVNADKIVIWGSSGGGFASLALASKIQGASAVAINPQVRVLEYEPKHAVNKFMDVCLRNRDAAALGQTIVGRLDMGVRWQQVTDSRVIYVQNIKDTHHYEVHFKAFCSDINFSAVDEWSPCRKFYFHLYDDPRGHASETIEMVSDVIKIINSADKVDGVCHE